MCASIRACRAGMGRVMKRSVLAAAAVLALAGGASAADLLGGPFSSTPKVATAPVFSWTGFYVGVNAGYVWTDNEAVLASVYPGGVLEIDVRNRTLPTKVSIESDGALAGVQAGYNVQIGALVVGVEADASLTAATDKATYSAPDLFLFYGAMTHSTFRSELDALGTLRARAGLAFDRALFYATGGFAVGEVTNGFDVNIPGFYANNWSHRRTEWGWAAGAGLEYALWNNLTAKVEYLYYNLGDETIRYTDPPYFGVEYIDYKFKHEGSIVRAGVNYKF
jgi:outer membrane immunogenic protein